MLWRHLEKSKHLNQEHRDVYDTLDNQKKKSKKKSNKQMDNLLSKGKEKDRPSSSSTSPTTNENISDLDSLTLTIIELDFPFTTADQPGLQTSYVTYQSQLLHTFVRYYKK